MNYTMALANNHYNILVINTNGEINTDHQAAKIVFLWIADGRNSRQLGLLSFEIEIVGHKLRMFLKTNIDK